MFKYTANVKYFTKITRSLTPFKNKHGIFTKRPLCNCLYLRFQHRICNDLILPIQLRQLSNQKSIVYERACQETLESLTEFFEDILEKYPAFASGDISFNDGVLTANLGIKFGTYVINRQSPNKQIWLSSPISGPKRFDYIENEKYWIYRHDGQTLHFLLQNEISNILGAEVDLSKCAYFKK